MTDTLIDYDSVRDWRVALYPPGTDVAAALTGEVVKQAGKGRTIDPETVSVLSTYKVVTATGVPQDVVALFGTLCLRYRLNAL